MRITPDLMDERIRRGIAAQLSARRRRIAAGEQPLGWKVGFGTPGGMKMLGVEHPLLGYLMRSGVIESGTELPLAEFTRAALEPEIAVYLGAAIDQDACEEEIRAAVSAIGPAIEIADITVPFSAGPEEILKRNVYQKGVVLGATDERRAGVQLGGLTASVEQDGIALDVPDDLESNTGAILDVLASVAGTLALVGERLEAGDLVIAGSIIPPLILEAASEISYTLGDAGPVSIRVS